MTLLLLAGALLVAAPAQADHITPGSQPGEVNPATIPPLWGSPGPDARAWADATTCSGGAKQGTVRVLAYLEYWWPRGESWGIYNCRLPSLHSEGRAVDYHLDVANAGDKNAGYAISRFFRSQDNGGAKWAMARRFGLQEIIYDCKIWTAARANDGWRHYSVCDDPNATYTDKHKDHIHIGQNHRGANRNTTAWTGFHYCPQCQRADQGTDVGFDPFAADPLFD